MQLARGMTAACQHHHGKDLVAITDTCLCDTPVMVTVAIWKLATVDVLNDPTLELLKKPVSPTKGWCEYHKQMMDGCADNA